MLRISVEKNILSRGVQRLPIARSLMLAGISLAVLSMPSFAQDTVVRKVLMTNDGITETTTTTTTSQAAPVAVDQVYIPTIAPSSVDRVFVGKPMRIADQTVIERVTVPSSTTSVQRVVIDGPVFKTTISEREKALRAVIATGVADGTLTAAQADRYRAELDRLSALELSVGGGTEVSYERVLPIAYEYDLLGTQLKVVNYRPLIQGNRIILSDTHVVAIDDLMNRRAGLEAKISYGLVSGKLSNSEADRLRGMLNHVAVVENSFRADGDISDREAKDLYSEFDKVGSAIDKAI